MEGYGEVRWYFGCWLVNDLFSIPFTFHKFTFCIPLALAPGGNRPPYPLATPFNGNVKSILKTKKYLYFLPPSLLLKFFLKLHFPATKSEKASDSLILINSIPKLIADVEIHL